MNENIKQLPAEDVKKMLLTGQVDINLLDEEMLLYLLDYEMCCAAGNNRKTKFYKMCIGALSKFVDFNVRDEELDAVVSSAYFLCFNKREQRRLLKRLREKNGQSGVKKKCPPHLVEWIICVIAFLFLTAFLTGTFILYSERISGARKAHGFAYPNAIEIGEGIRFSESLNGPLFSSFADDVQRNSAGLRLYGTAPCLKKYGYGVSDDKEFIKGIYINTDVKQEYAISLRNASIEKVRLLALKPTYAGTGYGI